MQTYDTSNIRSFALVGHGGCGKTSMAEAIAYLTGQNTRLGSVTDGTSLMDFEPEEQKRAGSILASYLVAEFDGYKYHVVDTPGDGNYIHEAQQGLQAVDSAVIVVSAVDGVEVSTEKASAYAASQELPRAVFINKMDRDHVDYVKVIAEVREVLGLSTALLQLPIGTGDGFRGVVGLVDRKAYVYEGDSGVPAETEVPAELADQVEEAVEALVESVAETDDELLEKYFDEGGLTEDEVREGLGKAILSGQIVPVVLGSAPRNIGLDRLLSLMRSFPSASDRPVVAGHEPGEADVPIERSADPDGPFAALCVKTLIDRVGSISVLRLVSGTAAGDTQAVNARTGDQERFGSLFHLVGNKRISVDNAMPGDIFCVAKLRDTRTGDTLTHPKARVELPYHEPPPPMISFTVKPKSRADVDKLKSGLVRLLAEDPGLRVTQDDVTKELVLAGMGTSHVQLAVDKMQRKYGVSVELGTPSIPYRETIQGSADVRYRHKKQTGGAGQFGEVAIRASGSTRGEGFVFVNKVVGGVIPTSLIPSVEKGVRDQLSKGILAGFPVVDITVELYDGKSHPVDSKDIAFQIAGRQAIKEAVLKARPVMLEPIHRMAVVAPEEQVGDIMGDMNTRRGRILNMETRGRNAVVNVRVPLAEVLSYAPDLRSMTGGKGSYTMEFDGYEQVPAHLQDKLVAELKRQQEEDD